MKKLIKKINQALNYRDLLWLLVVKDLKVKYKNSFLGYLWSMLDPILNMLVLTLIFSTIFKRQIPNYPVYLLSGRILYSYANHSSSTGMRSVVNSAALLKKTNVPKFLFTLSKVTSGLVDLIFEMGALLVVIIVTGVPIRPVFLLTPLILAQIFVFTLGLALFLAQFAVFFRDIFYVYGVFTTLWMYLTPIFYPMNVLPEHIARAIRTFNPLYGYVYNFRNIVMALTAPDWGLYWYGWMQALIVFVIGFICFVKKQDKFILYL